MKKTILSLGLATSSVFAINLGVVSISPEVGATVSYAKIGLSNQNLKEAMNLKVDSSKLAWGGYARIWVEALGMTISPQVKYDRLPSLEKSKKQVHNLQYGVVLGYRIPVIGLTPFAGGSYSTFSGSDIKLKDTFAVNFGLRLEFPFVPFLIIGFEGSWQQPKTAQQTKVEMLNLGGAIGLSF